MQTKPELEPPTRIPWPPILIVAAVGAAVALGRIAPLQWPGLDDTPAQIIGLLFGVGGMALIVWSVATLRKYGTTVMPHERSTVLVTSGPYRFRRNPIYLAELMLFFGVAELTKNVWFVVAGLVFAVLVTALSIIPEERHLEETFGEAYTDYKSRTRRWI